MSIINSEVKPFKATAFHNGKFVEVSDADLRAAWRRELLPRATVLTPNRCEALALLGLAEDDPTPAPQLAEEEQHGNGQHRSGQETEQLDIDLIQVQRRVHDHVDGAVSGKRVESSPAEAAIRAEP